MVCHLRPKRRIQPLVDVNASGTIRTNAVKPIVMNGRLPTSARIPDQSKVLIRTIRREVQGRVEKREESEHAPGTESRRSIPSAGAAA